MRIRCRLAIGYRSARDAAVIAGSLRVDDEAYIRTTVRGRTVTAETEADSFGGLLHTVEDYLACVSVAEKLLRR